MALPDFLLMPMQRILLKSRIHRASVAHCDLNCEGSCAIDEDLLEASNMPGHHCRICAA